MHMESLAIQILIMVTENTQKGVSAMFDGDNKPRWAVMPTGPASIIAIRGATCSDGDREAPAYRECIDGEGPFSGQANPVLYTRCRVIGLQFPF